MKTASHDRGTGARARMGWARTALMRAIALGAALGVLAGPGLAVAQPAQVNAAQTTKQPGDYGGVVPGDGAGDSKKPKAPGRVTWIGFQPRSDGSARVFVQLTSEATFTQELQGEVLLVKIDGVRFSERNLGRRLDTRFFDTALRQVKARRVGKRSGRKDQAAQGPGIELRIEFKNASDARQAQAELRAEEDGYQYLYLDFGPAGIRVSE